MSVTLVIAILSLAISLCLGLLKVWETFLSRSRFHVIAEWYDASDYELELQITVANVGFRPDSIRLISLINEAGESYRNHELSQGLPVLLQPGAVSSRFAVPVRTDIANDPGTSLFVGKGRLRLHDARGDPHDFPVPGAYEGKGIYSPDEELPPPDPEMFPDA